MTVGSSQAVNCHFFRGEKMTGREIIERSKKITSVAKVGEDILIDALKRLEIMIEKYAGREHTEFDEEKNLLACGGGISKEYDELYEAYVKREAHKVLEDWDCFEKYDSIYLARWSALREEITRTTKSKDTSIQQDWNWKNR